MYGCKFEKIIRQIIKNTKKKRCQNKIRIKWLIIRFVKMSMSNNIITNIRAIIILKVTNLF